LSHNLICIPQLVENEELIGTLIETNDRIIAALEMYDNLSSPKPTPAEDSSEKENPAYQGKTESEIIKLQARQKAALERAREEAATTSSGNIHPDLQDLSFGPLGNEKMYVEPCSSLPFC
jgi:LAS seventeen-binding protein 5